MDKTLAHTHNTLTYIIRCNYWLKFHHQTDNY